jgi:hypothetical protein
MKKDFFLLEQGRDNNICLIFLNGGAAEVKEAAKKAQRELGCGLLMCRSNSSCVELFVYDKKYVVDLNLVWTSGKFVLSDGTPVSNVESHELYQDFREQIFWPARNFVEGFKVLIAFYANGERDFLANKYIGCGLYEKQIKKVFLADDVDKGSYVLVADKNDFDKLAVLRQFDVGLLEYYFDDRTFPIWVCRKGKRGFNIVANSLLDPQQAIKVQLKMLEAVLSVI